MNAQQARTAAEAARQRAQDDAATRVAALVEQGVRVAGNLVGAFAGQGRDEGVVSLEPLPFQAAPPNRRQQVAALVAQRLRDDGFEVTPEPGNPLILRVNWEGRGP